MTSAFVMTFMLGTATSGCSLVGLGIGRLIPAYEAKPPSLADGSPDATAVARGARVEVEGRGLPDPPLKGTSLGIRESVLGSGEIGPGRALLIVANEDGERAVPVDRLIAIRVRTRDGSYWRTGLRIGCVLDVAVSIAAHLTLMLAAHFVR